MGRIFISAGHGAGDPGIKVGDTTEAQEMILLRNQIVTQLGDRGFQNSEVLSVPDNLSISQTIQWINERRKTGDVAVEIHAAASTNPVARGATVYYIALNNQRQKHAERLLSALLDGVPELSNRGAKPDTAIGVKGLPFCRVVSPASLLLEVAFLTNPEDRSLLQNQRDNFAQGIANGLAEWSRAVSGTKLSYPQISVTLNQKIYKDKGILLSGNAYVPTDLVKLLGVDLPNARFVRRVQYQGVIYARAVDLRNYDISVNWDSTSRTVILQPSLNPKIIGQGKASAEQLLSFLRANNTNPKTVDNFSDLPNLYIEEAQQEGVNHDIAFCQMCVETDFLRFGGDMIKPTQNNFGGLAGAISSEIATFGSARLGVRAHIQHLKAYGSKDGKSSEHDIVDPGFRFVGPGSAPTLEELTRRWSAKKDAQPYGTKILDTLRSLYKSIGLL